MNTEAFNRELLAVIVQRAHANQLDRIVPGLESELRTVADIEAMERGLAIAATNLRNGDAPAGIFFSTSISGIIK